MRRAGSVVAGWDTGFAGMHVGGKRRLFVPFQLAYGPQGRAPAIPARAELIFELAVSLRERVLPALGSHAGRSFSEDGAGGDLTFAVDEGCCDGAGRVA